MTRLEKYTKELDEMLKKKDWTLVEPFLKDNLDIVNEGLYKQFCNSATFYKKLTYISTVMNRTSIDEETKKYALKLRKEL